MSPAIAIESLYAAGHWLFEQQRYADAASIFRTMALAAPSDERAWLALGACHERIGQTSVAEALYRSGVALAKAPVRCALARARLLKTLGRDDDAEAALERAAAIADGANDEDAAALVLAERSAA